MIAAELRITTIDALNTQTIAEPAIATAVGCIALIAAVPLTTALAAALIARIPARDLPDDHAHPHEPDAAAWPPPSRSHDRRAPTLSSKAQPIVGRGGKYGTPTRATPIACGPVQTRPLERGKDKGGAARAGGPSDPQGAAPIRRPAALAHDPDAGRAPGVGMIPETDSTVASASPT